MLGFLLWRITASGAHIGWAKGPSTQMEEKEPLQEVEMEITFALKTFLRRGVSLGPEHLVGAKHPDRSRL